MFLKENIFTKEVLQNILQRKEDIRTSCPKHLQGQSQPSRTPNKQKDQQQQSQEPEKEEDKEERASNARYTAIQTQSACYTLLSNALATTGLVI